MRVSNLGLGGSLPMRVGPRSPARRRWPRSQAACASRPVRGAIAAAEPAAGLSFFIWWCGWGAHWNGRVCRPCPWHDPPPSKNALSRGEVGRATEPLWPEAASPPIRVAVVAAGGRGAVTETPATGSQPGGRSSKL